MARQGSRLEYPRRSEVIHFIQTAASSGGEVVEMDVEALPAGGRRPPLHSHPGQDEEFEVLSGRLAYQLGDREGIAVAGERAVIPAGVAHTWWNGGDEPLLIKGWVRPAMRFETFVESVYGVHRPGYAMRGGRPNPLRLAVVMWEFRHEWTPRFMPRAVRFTVLPALAFIGRLLGYRWWYPEFSPEGPVELPPGAARAVRSVAGR